MDKNSIDIQITGLGEELRYDVNGFFLVTVTGDAHVNAIWGNAKENPHERDATNLTVMAGRLPIEAEKIINLLEQIYPETNVRKLAEEAYNRFMEDME
jgi:hypothetical protein